MPIATIILAAGNSSRLGQPKQLLTAAGQTLIRRMTETALSLQAGPVVVVLGAHAHRIKPELVGLSAKLVVNDHWQMGMASSLHAGLNALVNDSYDAFLVLLTDQPYVTADLLQQLIDTRKRTGNGIVTSQYGADNRFGVPALFDIRYRAEFMNLTGDVGARYLIRQHADDCIAVPFPLGEIDLDTAEDVAHWRDS